MTDATTIRPVEPADHDGWAELFRGYRAFYGMAPDDAVVETVWGWLGDAEHELNALVAARDGRLAAIAHWRRFARPSRGTTAIFLDDLFTAEEARGEGIGGALIAALQRIAAEEGASEVRWITAESNVAAQRLCDRVAERVPFFTYIAPPA